MSNLFYIINSCALSMRKLIFIIVLFFSTSVFALEWFETSDKFSLDLFVKQGYEIVDVKQANSGAVAVNRLIYTLSHRKEGVIICVVDFDLGLRRPVNTKCYVENIKDL